MSEKQEPGQERDDPDEITTKRVNEIFASTFDRVALSKMAETKGVHPDDVTTLFRWAALGLTHLCWRNSVLEDWHAGPDSQMSDGQMLRANVATSRIFGEALRYWFGECEFHEGTCLADVAEIEPDWLASVLSEAAEEVTDPERRLPHGLSLADIGKDQVEELGAHAFVQIDALHRMADQNGADVVLLWLAVRGLWSCSDWWGTPGWPLKVDRWLAYLDDPDHAFWHGRRPRTPPGPAGDRGWLRRTLLSAPDELPDEVASWCIASAIGFVGD